MFKKSGFAFWTPKFVYLTSVGELRSKTILQFERNLFSNKITKTEHSDFVYAAGIFIKLLLWYLGRGAYRGSGTAPKLGPPNHQS